MRRSRFAREIEASDSVSEWPSIRDTLWFDVRNPERSDEVPLAEWRVAGLDHIALLMGFTHLLVIVGYVLLSSSLEWCLCLDNPLIPSVLVIIVDAIAAGALITRERFNISTHAMVRALCVYLVVAGLLWTWFGQTVRDDAFVTQISAAQIVMCAGIGIGAIVSVSL